MAVYSIEGKLGTGKTKFAVWRAQRALSLGLRVASNVDLRLGALVPSIPASYIRVPDKPTSADLMSIGHGNPESYDEDKNGLLILDELGTWLNSRSFQDKSRSGVIDWLIHARKYGWDVLLIVQDAGMIDKQVREALVEYSCRCVRLDKVRIPLIGKPLNLLLGGRAGYMPRMHLVTARLGSGANVIVAERWRFRGDDLHAAYDTRQIFTDQYAYGAHTVLPAWDWKRPLTFRERLRLRWASFVGERRGISAPLPRPKLPSVLALMRLPAEVRMRALPLAWKVHPLSTQAVIVPCNAKHG